MNIKKYEDLIVRLNKELKAGNFDINSNKENLEKIMKIYELLKNKNYSEALGLINEISKEKEEKKTESVVEFKSFVWSIMPAPAPSLAAYPEAIFDEFNEWEAKCRDWDIWNFDEENIEAFNSIEMMSAIFLENLKNELWQNK